MSTFTKLSRSGHEAYIHSRYSIAAHEKEASLCCPVQYRPKYLDAIPDEILERDYGCGDPTPYVREGETVLDLGPGGGKICYILSQVVGSQGRVIGVDCNRPKHRHPRVTKGQEHDATTESSGTCIGSGGNCC